MLNIWKSFAGEIEVEVTSADLEKLMQLLLLKGVEAANILYQSELTLIFRIPKSDYAKVSSICENVGASLRIRRKIGLWWIVSAFVRRWILIGGILIFLVWIFLLPAHVFFVCVEGNTQIPDNRILEAAEHCGITFGAPRREVRSEKVKNALLAAVPELQWAGVNTRGCVAVISVKERMQPTKCEPEKIVSNIVSVRDGYVLSGTVLQGNALFTVGQTVREGQVLISAYTDCGISIRAERAEGEVIAQTTHEIHVVMPKNVLYKPKETVNKQKISLLIRKKRINLWKDSGISDTSCGRMYEEYYVTLPGGFRLPVALCIETIQMGEVQQGTESVLNTKQALQDCAQDYVTATMIAGEILEKKETLYEENGVYRLHGEYLCKEVISREQRVKIGDTNGKSD